MAGKLTQRQFKHPRCLVLDVDGSDVTTSYGNAALDCGKHCATVKKGADADSNLVTIKLKKRLGAAPQVLIQENTLDCLARLEVAVTVDEIQIRTLELDGVTKEDDADFTVFLFGPDYGESLEGWHL
jgi:hypothetical protein